MAAVVPVVAQHHTAVADMSGVGAAGAATVAEALGEIDLDALRPVEGRIDLDALTALHGPLTRVRAALAELQRTADASRSPWLVHRATYELDDFDSSVEEHLPGLDNALAAIELAPQMLGADTPRTYLMLFTTPSEARGLGGFVDSYVELRVDDGSLSLGESGPAQDLDLRNLAMTPHLPSVGSVAADLYAETTGRHVDGVIAMDPVVLGALLRYTGPIHLTTLDQQVDKSNAVLTMDALLAGALPEPITLADDLAPLASERRLLVWSADASEQALVERVDLAG